MPSARLTLPVETSAGNIVWVGDDPATASLVRQAAGLGGYEVIGYLSVDSLRGALPESPACLLLDIPVLSGTTDPVAMVRRLGVVFPVLLLCDQITVDAAVHAMGKGAFTVFQKQKTTQDLAERVTAAIDLDRRLSRDRSRRADAEQRLGRLTVKERQTLALVLEGQTNRQIAEQLGLSVRAVEDRRARTIRHAEVSNMLDLARLVEVADWSYSEDDSTPG